MRIRTEVDAKRDTALISFVSNCYTDAVPLVNDVFVANADFDIASNAFLLGCAILIRNHAGEQIEFEGRKIGGDYAEAVRAALSATPTVGPINAENRTLALGEIDVACFPARLRDIEWPVDTKVPLIFADWSGDFVPPGGRRSGEQIIGRYFTNAGLIADETTVSVALGLMVGGNRLRRLLVPLTRGAPAHAYDALVEALAIAGIELIVVSQKTASGRTNGKHAVVMLSHTANNRVLAHFERLRRETEGLMPAFLAMHNPKGLVGSKADIVVTEDAIAALMPTRHRELDRVRGRYDKGFVDLVTQAVAFDPLLRDFEHLWFIEYDVDFSGNWADFFGPTMDDDADLLTSRLLTKDELPHWSNWVSFRHPPDLAPNQRLTSFMPASRQSRTFIECYREEMETGRWQGHSESTVPSIALYRGLRIVDMLVASPSASGEHPLVDNFTYGYRPARSDAYFHESPDSFTRQDRLYHPVKAVAQIDGLTVTRETVTRSPVAAKARRSGTKRNRNVEA